ncbi:glycosyltransferase [Rhodobacteraceae bacterium KMM 6894]|nr:glycosyltransferase [Rhodobacteraceae bacterium KMM 6894]
MAIRLTLAHLPSRLSTDRQAMTTPQFSVHVATCSEPPAVVIRTLRALLDQDWPAEGYEIILMDNNTADPGLWRPVERFCAPHAGRITFLHQTGVTGAKAGALNIALAHTDPRTTHIITVDADYVVERDFLTLAANALGRTGADFVQFPQSYVGTVPTAAGVDAELEEYFRTNAAVADEAEAVLLTGTLCVISKHALIAAGGWSGATTTEDAELGVRLCQAGFAGRFINQVVGKGLLPLSLADLEKQRYRWCSGNFQTLMRHLRTIFTPAGSFNLHKRLVIVSQLTAWFNLALVPSVLLVIWLVTGQGGSVAAALAAGVIVLSLCDIALRVIARGLRDGLPLSVILHALACRIALAPQSSKATFDAATGMRLKFLVTDKSGDTRADAAHLPLCHLGLFALALVLLFGIQPANPLVIVALLILMAPLPAALLTDRSLRAYRKAMVPSTMEYTA